MKVNKLFGLAVAMLASVAAFGQQAPKVRADFPAKATAGKVVTGIIRVTFAPGLHGYQNPPTKDYLVPLSITISDKLAKLKSVKYPAGIDAKVGGEDKPVKVYEGTVNIPVTLLLPKKLGKRKVTFVVRYQECNETACFPPADVTTTALFTVK